MKWNSIKKLMFLCMALLLCMNLSAQTTTWLTGTKNSQTIAKNTTVTIPAGNTVTINGDLTIIETLNVYGTLIVNGNVILSSESNGWFNSYYGSLTINSGAEVTVKDGNVEQKDGTTVTLNGGFFIVKDTDDSGDGNYIMNGGSLKYSSGESYVICENFTQETDADIYNYATGTLVVVGTFTDKGTVDGFLTSESEHPWQVKRNPTEFVVNNNFNLFVNSYDYAGYFFSALVSGLDKLLTDLENSGYDAKEIIGALENVSGLLPIELTYFTVNQTEEGIEFEWETESETDNDYFTLEYSVDGEEYESVVKVFGAGTSTQTNYYSYIDSVSAYSQDFVYFRLKQTDYNGNCSYSDVVTLNIERIQKDDKFVVYPSPTTNYIQIEGGEYNSVEFADVHNRIYLTPVINKSENQYDVSQLPSGVCLLIIKTDNGIKVVEFLKK